MKIRRGGKVLYPDCGITKADVAAYYRDIAPCLLPHLEDRFLTLHRFPDGIGAEGFYQQSRPDHFPTVIRGREARRAGGGEPIRHMLVDAAEGLVYLADQATLALHGWLSRCDRPDRPDRIVFDLDPADDDFTTVKDCACLLAEVLPLAGLSAWVMTTGSRGLHVAAPIERRLGFDAARDLARTLAAAVAERHPGRFTLEQRIRARRGRLYIDIGRNAYGQTAILPYSLRALPGAPVATPLDWPELRRPNLGPRRYTLSNLRRRLGQKPDPWRDFRGHAKRPVLDPDALAAWCGREKHR